MDKELLAKLEREAAEVDRHIEATRVEAEQIMARADDVQRRLRRYFRCGRCSQPEAPPPGEVEHAPIDHHQFEPEPLDRADLEAAIREGRAIYCGDIEKF
jgi:hypothetical protein